MKALVMGLLLANGVVFAWWQGLLSPLIDPPGLAEREPLRLARQLRPEAVRVVPAGSNARGTGPALAAGAAASAALTPDAGGVRRP